MKTEDKLRAAMREYTESVEPSTSAWNRIRERIEATRPKRSLRPMASATLAVALIGALVSVRLITDRQIGEVDITEPGPRPPIFGETVPGQWQALPAPPVKNVWFSTSTWTGKEFLLWTGRGSDPGVGVAYNPGTRRWRELPPFVVGGRGQAPAVWTGTEMIVWGGTLDESGGEDRLPYTDGAAFDPATDRWRRIAESPLYGGAGHFAVWTGAEMLVWGSRPAGNRLANELAAYDPATDRWRELPAGPLDGRWFPSVTWTGREMLVWGSASADGSVDGAAFDPDSQAWRMIPAAPLAPRRLATTVWTGTELFVWGGQALDESDLADGARYNPITNRWTKLAKTSLSPRHFASAVPTTKGIWVWGGTGTYVEGEPAPPYFNDGALYDPESNSWHALPKAPLSAREANAEVVFTGEAVLLWGGLGEENDSPPLDGATFTFEE